MNARYRLTALSLLTAVACSANGDPLLGPLHGNTLQLADHTVSIYYTVTGDRYEVVTTVGANPQHDYLMRFVAELADREQHSITLGGYGANTANATLTISRAGSQILADVHTPVPGQTELSHAGAQ